MLQSPQYSLPSKSQPFFYGEAKCSVFGQHQCYVWPCLQFHHCGMCWEELFKLVKGNPYPEDRD